MSSPPSPLKPRGPAHVLWHLRARTVLVGIGLLLAMQVAWWWVPGRDAAAYLSIARGIAHGELARFGSPHLYYAPGYPLLASPAFLLGDRPFLALSLLQLLFSLVAAWAVQRWLRRIVGEASPLLTALVFVNVGLWALFRATLGEMAFLMLLMLAVEALHDVDGKIPLRRLVSGGAWLALAVLTRQAGVTLLGGVAMVVALAVRGGGVSLRRGIARAAVIGVPAAAVFLAVQWHDAATGAGAAAGYLGQAVDADRGLGAQLLEGVRLRMAELGRLLVPGMHKAYAPARTWLHVNTLLHGAVTVFVAVGWTRAVRARRDVLLWAAPCYVLLYVVWPFDQGTRFMAPLLPVWVAALWFALGAFPRIAGARRTVVVLLLAAHLAVAVGAWIRGLDVRRYDDRWPAVDQVVERVGDQRDAVRTIGLERAERLMLQVGLDRPLLEDDDPGSRPRWVVVGGDAAVPAGFVEAQRAGPWRLAHAPR